MFTWIVQMDGCVQQVFVGEKAGVIAARWAIKEILQEYTWDSGQRMNALDLNGDGSWERVTGRMKEQGLHHPKDIAVLYRMLCCLGKGHHMQAVRALAKLRPGLTVDTSHHAQVHMQGLVLSGTGVMDLFGLKEKTFIQLDQGLLEREVQVELYQHALEHDPLLFRKPDFLHWRELMEQQAYREAHLHFVNSSIHRVLDIDFEDEMQVLVSPRNHLEQHWRDTQPALRAAGPNLFTVAHALMRQDTGHLTVASADLIKRAEHAVALHQQYMKVQQAYELCQDENGWRPLEHQKGQISLELTRLHLLPELVRLDPHLDPLFFKFTGEHLLDVLTKMEFMPGDNGGWCDLAVKYKNVHLSFTDATPDYPRLDDVALTLTFDDHPEEYQVVVTGTSLSVNTSNSFRLLVGL